MKQFLAQGERRPLVFVKTQLTLKPNEHAVGFCVPPGIVTSTSLGETMYCGFIPVLLNIF